MNCGLPWLADGSHALVTPPQDGVSARPRRSVILAGIRGQADNFVKIRVRVGKGSRLGPALRLYYVALGSGLTGFLRF